MYTCSLKPNTDLSELEGLKSTLYRGAISMIDLSVLGLADNVMKDLFLATS
jgi:hypothetical protein